MTLFRLADNLVVVSSSAIVINTVELPPFEAALSGA